MGIWALLQIFTQNNFDEAVQKWNSGQLLDVYEWKELTSMNYQNPVRILRLRTSNEVSQLAIISPSPNLVYGQIQRDWWRILH